MTKRLQHISRMITPLLFLLWTAGGAAAAELWETAQEPDQPLPAVEGAVRGEDERQVETFEQKGGFLGQSAVVTRNYGGRAFEYGFLHSSVSGGLFFKKLEKESNFDLEGSFLNEHDYHGDLQYDYRGDYRLHLRTESLWHNLDRELLFTQPPAGTLLSGYHPVQDPQSNYGVSAVQQSADFRYRLHNYPLHVNLGYWRYEKEGTIQQRFADVSFERATNTIYAASRDIHYQTQEGHVGVDSHLGPVDLIYDFRVRVFKDREPIPVSPYAATPPVTVAGNQQHNEDPDSRFYSHTVKLHTSLAGGVVAAGSYSYETRENLSRLSDTTGAKYISLDLQNAAADFTYTPIKEMSLALKYRRQQIDNENRGTVTDVNFTDPVQPVKPPVDSVKDLVTATLSYKPRRDLSVVGQYKGEFVNRDNVSSLPGATTWALPENTETHQGSLVVHYRPVKGLRVDTNYTYAATDHPAYGNSFERKHEGKILATYSRNNSWGGSANVIIRREWNDEVGHYLIQLPLDPLTYSAYPLTSRERKTENANLAGWFVPFSRLTLSANYAYLQTKVDQPVLFAAFGTGDQAAADFLTRSHVYGVSAAYAAAKDLDLSLTLQQVRSISEFEPQDTVFVAATPGPPPNPGSGTGGITDITRQDTVISFASVRGEYRFTPEISSSLEYSYRDYNEKNPAYSAYNGTVHTVFAALAAKW